MSALEVIEKIKALPPNEQAQVVDFVHKIDAARHDTVEDDRSIRYAPPEQAKAAGEKVLQQYGEVFRKLAE